MAITIVQSPNPGSSMYSPLWHVASSTNVANTDFRYVFDVYVGGTLVVRLKVMPDDLLRGRLDVSRIVRSYVPNYFAPKFTLTAPKKMDTDDIQVEYDVFYGEEYTTGGVSTIYTNQATGTYNVWNAYNVDTPPALPYEPLDGLAYEWLTNRDTTSIWMPRDGTAFLSYNNAPSQENHQMTVQEIDINGNPIGIQHNTGSPINSTGFLVVFDLNPTFINSADWGVGITAIPSTAVGYRISVYRASGFTQSSWAYVYFMDEPKVKAVPLFFLNRYGAFDTFYFSGPTRKAQSIERKTTQRIPTYEFGNTIREYNPQTNVYSDTVINYGQRIKNTRKLTSGFLRDRDMTWLSEILASPQVYLLENDYYYPVTIVTDKWTEKLNRFDKMYNLEIEVATGREIISQTR